MLNKPKDPMPMPPRPPKPGIPKMPDNLKRMPSKPGMGLTPKTMPRITPKDQAKKDDAKKKIDMNMRDRMVAPGMKNRMSAKQRSLKNSLEKTLSAASDMRNNASMVKRKVTGK